MPIRDSHYKTIVSEIETSGIVLLSRLYAKIGIFSFVNSVYNLFNC